MLVAWKLFCFCVISSATNEFVPSATFAVWFKRMTTGPTALTQGTRKYHFNIFFLYNWSVVMIFTCHAVVLTRLAIIKFESFCFI